MMRASVEIPKAVRLKALSEGRVGQAWLTGLPGTVADLANDWNLSIGRALGGGTEALVVEAITRDGRAAVLKVDRPGRDPSGGEARTLLAAGGCGYADVFAHDRARGALLLERLGPPLAKSAPSVDEGIVVLCETLRRAWTVPPEGERFMNGAEKAESLARLIEANWLATGRPLFGKVVDRALAFAESRRRAFDPRDAVLAHGDAHPWNALRVPGSDPPRYKFVDPDGLFVERAYDLGISLREWTEELLAGDPVALGLRRCECLASLAGVEARPIWEWGFIECVSTALLCLQVGLPGASEMLAIVDAWTDQPPP